MREQEHLVSHLITTEFSAESTAAEVAAGTDLSGKHIVVTGGASGIGAQTARALADAGARVTLTARTLTAAAAVAHEITAATGNHVRAAAVDLTDLTSIEAFAEQWTGRLDVLINNAGVMMPPDPRTSRGWDSQFVTNHLGHAALTFALHDALAESGAARIVSVSSSAHLLSDIQWDDIHFERIPYNPLLAYAQSKTANTLFAVAATQRWSAEGITANAVHPGVIPDTGLQRHVAAIPGDTAKIQNSAQVTPAAIKTPQQGAATTVLVATSPLLEGVGGRYFEDCREAGPNVAGERTGYAPWALDPAAADKLWHLTREHLTSAMRH
ncbi:SDR family NAD(P)-dependent oxidoreductase [Nocardia panacis]|uniref:Probable oxidoreductase n=1 Tax=Nocardia panacis TaxID=2340916 RepID=A0A3A4L1G3_9NOCA|nr:SDR family NAD(P)-dependent oxidoreductase [Nocardia panacis]RJO75825.1 SDR family NAD(P)-dependent oxidoreductase [Nocardia panacis]